jgi:hypothetical protein
MIPLHLREVVTVVTRFESATGTAEAPATAGAAPEQPLTEDWAPVAAIAHASLNSPDGAFFSLLPDDARTGTPRGPRRSTWRRSV